MLKSVGFCTCMFLFLCRHVFNHSQSRFADGGNYIKPTSSCNNTETVRWTPLNPNLTHSPCVAQWMCTVAYSVVFL